MKKRDRKRLDYGRIKSSKGDDIDPSLADSVEVFEALNAQLIEELPLLSSLITRTFDILFIESLKLRASFFAKVCIIMERNFKASKLQVSKCSTVALIQESMKNLNILNFTLDNVPSIPLPVIVRRAQSARIPAISEKSVNTLARNPSLRDSDKEKTGNRAARAVTSLLDDDPWEDLTTLVAPISPQKSLVVYQALFGYSATRSDELTLVKGRKYKVLEQDLTGKGWWMAQCILTGESGLLPSNYVSPWEK